MSGAQASLNLKMYILDADNNITRIKITNEYEALKTFVHQIVEIVEVCVILSPEDEEKSLWGNIVYDVPRSSIYHTHEAAKKASFKRKLGMK